MKYSLICGMKGLSSITLCPPPVDLLNVMKRDLRGLGYLGPKIMLTFYDYCEKLFFVNLRHD